MLENALTFLAGAAGLYIAVSLLVGVLFIPVVGAIFYKIWKNFQ